MTSNTTPLGQASASSEYSASGAAWNAFDPNSVNGWLTANTASGWLQYRFVCEQLIVSYGIVPWSIDNFPGRTPKDWTLQGSPDGVHWTVLDRRVNQSWPAAYVRRLFTVANPGVYRFYRLNVTANNGNSYLGIHDFALYAEEFATSSRFLGSETPTNFPPIVDAGADQHVAQPLSTAVTLDGSSTDDGLPASPGVVTYLWTQISGPGTATFDDDTDPATTVTFDEFGTYVLRLTADDDALTGYDDVTIEIAEAMVEVLVVGGGGAGGTWCGGGGGAGGAVYHSAYPISLASFLTVTVGAGAPRMIANGQGGDGQSSFFDTIEAKGGGGGGAYSPSENGRDGASGGGAAHGVTGVPGAGSSPQGHPGGMGSANDSSGGGGGVGEAGHEAVTTTGGTGGMGREYAQFASVAGSPAGWFAGGGGGWGNGTPGAADANGGGGDGDGGSGTETAENGVTNTGGGGGGGHYHDYARHGGGGGSGIVIIRYLTASLNGRGGTKTTDGSYTIHTFTASGTFFADSPENPWVDAGPDQVARAPLSYIVQLDGSATDDGSPATLSYEWTQEGHYVLGASTLVPNMTSATTPSGVASAQYQEVGQEAWRAFNTAGNWGVAWRRAAWVQYQFAVATRVDGYGIESTTSTSQAPRDWTFEGSDDGVNWTILGTETNKTGWTAGVERLFPVQQELKRSYLYYRVNISNNCGDYHTTIQRIRFYGREMTGSGVATFDDATDPQTTVTFDEFGTYLLRLTVSDAESPANTGYDEVEITLEEGVPARVTQAPVETLLAEATVRARVTQAPVEVLILSPGDPQRLTQVLVETIDADQTSTTRLSQAFVEVLTPTVVASRLTQALVELLTPTVVETRWTQTLAEIGLQGAFETRGSQTIVELLGKSSTYCGPPALSPAALCGKPDVLAWLEWTVPMREN
jgi:hypothetical protein